MQGALLSSALQLAVGLQWSGMAWGLAVCVWLAHTCMSSLLALCPSGTTWWYCELRIQALLFQETFPFYVCARRGSSALSFSYKWIAPTLKTMEQMLQCILGIL